MQLTAHDTTVDHHELDLAAQDQIRLLTAVAAVALAERCEASPQLWNAVEMTLSPGKVCPVNSPRRNGAEYLLGVVAF